MADWKQPGKCFGNKECGADAVKLQKRQPVLHASPYNQVYDNPNAMGRRRPSGGAGIWLQSITS
jgi:hypothetical protein